MGLCLFLALSSPDTRELSRKAKKSHSMDGCASPFLTFTTRDLRKEELSISGRFTRRNPSRFRQYNRWKAQFSRRDDAPGAVHQECVGISLEVFAMPPKTIEQFQFQHLSAIGAQNFLICHLLYFLQHALVFYL